jgi:integrase
MKVITIQEGINAVINYYHKFRTDCTTKRYEKACITIQDHYEKSAKVNYCATLNNQIRNNLCDNPDNSGIFGYPDYRIVFRVLGMLDDYCNGKPFQNNYPYQSRYKHQLQPAYQELVVEFKESLTVTKNTIMYIYSIARDFFYYIQKQNIYDMNNIQQEILYAFMMQEYQDNQGSMNNVVYALRQICVFLNQKGFQQVPTEFLPFALPASRKKIYPAFSPEDMKSILLQPDTSTLSGKRDYAVLILASVTGMRAIDIANLKLFDIRWKERTIHFIQHKTGNSVALPLDPKATFAISDYILNGRPESDNSYIFLTESKPFHKLSDKSSIANILNKCIIKAGIEKSPYDGKSFHAFRRNMGIWLLNTSSSPELISQILGHRSRDVLKRYLPLTTHSLSICALGFEDIQVQAEVYK